MSTNPKARAWVEVSADALRRNYARIGDAAGPDARILPMVKADAYGLGVAEVVRCLEPLEPWGFGVAAVREGLELRALGVRRPVVVSGTIETSGTMLGGQAADAFVACARKRFTKVSICLRCFSSLTRVFSWISSSCAICA